MISLNFKNRDKLLIAAIVLLIFLNIFRSLSLELDGSSGSNLCNKIDSEVKYFLLYDKNLLPMYPSPPVINIFLLIMKIY